MTADDCGSTVPRPGSIEQDHAQVTIRFLIPRGGSRMETWPAYAVADRLAGLASRRLAAKAELRDGTVFGESWKNPEGRWAWYCIPICDVPLAATRGSERAS